MPPFYVTKIELKFLFWLNGYHLVLSLRPSRIAIVPAAISHYAYAVVSIGHIPGAYSQVVPEEDEPLPGIIARTALVNFRSKAP